MGFLVEYKGGINVEDYKLDDYGDGNGFGIKSEHCIIMNDFDTRTHKGMIELTTDTVTRGAITLGDSERIVMTCEDAEDLISMLKDAIEEAEPDQWELRERNEAKAAKVCANMNKKR
tara:strand:- start:167 stop:517 length:351 start_codon:yes stop_codon:yes gene_type:complete